MVDKADFSALAEWCQAAPADANLINVVETWLLVGDGDGGEASYAGHMRFSPARFTNWWPEHFSGLLVTTYPQPTFSYGSGTAAIAMAVSDRGSVFDVTFRYQTHVWGGEYDLGDVIANDGTVLGVRVDGADMSFWLAPSIAFARLT